MWARTADFCGSSPRVWGTHAAAEHELTYARFIPTRVGNTRRSSSPRHRMPVHPHACGEHLSVSTTNPSTPGSSPRVWGTQELHKANGRAIRFIPTRVGNTHTTESAVQSCCGSSPRVWGTLIYDDDGAEVERFIPTRVGNTHESSRVLAGSAVHPHACGEHRKCANHSVPCGGSSPRVWGTRFSPESKRYQ